jgi:hypothetical protein
VGRDVDEESREAAATLRGAPRSRRRRWASQGIGDRVGASGRSLGWDQGRTGAGVGSAAGGDGGIVARRSIRARGRSRSGPEAARPAIQLSAGVEAELRQRPRTRSRHDVCGLELGAKISRSRAGSRARRHLSAFRDRRRSVALACAVRSLRALELQDREAGLRQQRSATAGPEGQRSRTRGSSALLPSGGGARRARDGRCRGVLSIQCGRRVRRRADLSAAARGSGPHRETVRDRPVAGLRGASGRPRAAPSMCQSASLGRFRTSIHRVPAKARTPPRTGAPARIRITPRALEQGRRVEDANPAPGRASSAMPATRAALAAVRRRSRAAVCLARRRHRATAPVEPNSSDQGARNSRSSRGPEQGAGEACSGIEGRVVESRVAAARAGRRRSLGGLVGGIQSRGMGRLVGADVSIRPVESVFSHGPWAGVTP